MSLIIAYNTVHTFDITCISEAYLNSSVNENIFLIPDYHLLRADKPDNLNPIQGRDEGQKASSPYRFFPCNFYKPRT